MLIVGDEVQDLARHLGRLTAPDRRVPAMRQVNVSSVGAGFVNVRFAGSTVDVPAKYLSSYSPVAGDVVWAMQNGPDLLVLGSQYPGAGWRTYVPVIGGTGWALNNGTITGRYSVDNTGVSVHVEITFGSSSIFGSAGMTVTLPPINAAVANTYGESSARQSTGGIRYPGISRVLTATTMQPLAILINGGAGTYARENGYTSTTPFTWVSGDQAFLDLTYEPG